MPMPKPSNPEQLSINGETPKALNKVAKPYKKDIPDLHLRMAELAEKAKTAEGAEQ